MKNCHICYIKNLKNAFFVGQRVETQSRERPLLHISFREKIQVAKQSGQLLTDFGKIQFQPNCISREAVGCEVVAIQQREFLCDKMKKFISLKPFLWEALSRELLARQPLNQFLKKNTKKHFEQKHKTRKYKITFKNK